MKTLLSIILIGTLKVVAVSPKGLKGLSKKGLVGLLDSLAREINRVFRKYSAQALIIALEGERIRWNFIFFAKLIWIDFKF